nr:PREDICTED: solute carrier organic anion transporter family member 4C1-like [Bemisia tabaci]
MGLLITLSALFGYIPGPIVYGKLLDSACLVAGKTCGGAGNCWLYDNKRLGFRLTATTAVLLFLSFSCNMAVWFHSKTLRNIYEDEEESQRKDDLSSKRNIDYFSDTNF